MMLERGAGKASRSEAGRPGCSQGRMFHDRAARFDDSGLRLRQDLGCRFRDEHISGFRQDRPNTWYKPESGLRNAPEKTEEPRIATHDATAAHLVKTVVTLVVRHHCPPFGLPRARAASISRWIC